MTKATIELAHNELTRAVMEEITGFLTHSSRWGWIDFQWTIVKEIEQ